MEALKSNCGVYLIVSPSNGRYVGSSKNLLKRFNRYKNLSCHNQYALISSFKKYGFENHKVSVLMYCNEDELLFWERTFGDIYLSLADFKYGLNIRLPGYGDVRPSLTEAMRAKIREGCKKRWDNPEERKKTSERAKKALKNPELRQKLQRAAINQWDSEARAKKSIERKKYYEDNPDAKSQYSAKIKEHIKNNPESAHKSYSALTNYYKNNPSARSELKKKYFKENPDKHPNSLKVVNTETNEVFPSIESVASLLGVTGTTITNRMKSNKYFPFKILKTA